MLEIKLNNNDIWGRLYCNKSLISDHFYFEKDIETYNVESFSEGIDYTLIGKIHIESIPEKIMLHLLDFDIMFKEFQVYRIRKYDERISVEFSAHYYEILKGIWSPKEFIKAAEDTLSRIENIGYTKNYDLENLIDTYINTEVFMPLQNKQISDYINEAKIKLESIYSEIVIELNGLAWRTEYEKNEKLFTTEMVIPLMRRLNFKGVRYYHGINEYGKDVIAYKINEFGIKDYCAVQVKAGNISGNAKGAVEELIHQIDDAFQMPFELINDKDNNTISKMIIAISGTFTNNAQQKIKAKVNKSLLGNIVFLDKQDILNLAKR